MLGRARRHFSRWSEILHHHLWRPYVPILKLGVEGGALPKQDSKSTSKAVQDFFHQPTKLMSLCLCLRMYLHVCPHSSYPDMYIHLYRQYAYIYIYILFVVIFTNVYSCFARVRVAVRREDITLQHTTPHYTTPTHRHTEPHNTTPHCAVGLRLMKSSCRFVSLVGGATHVSQGPGASQSGTHAQAPLHVQFLNIGWL